MDKMNVTAIVQLITGVYIVEYSPPGGGGIKSKEKLLGKKIKGLGKRGRERRDKKKAKKWKKRRKRRKREEKRGE